MESHGDSAETNPVSPTGLLPGRETCVGRALDSEKWSVAEERVGELITRIQPNEESGKQRQAIADYFQSLIGKYFPCQVFIVGSVPLMTYLPDGDVDLTVFSSTENLKDTWIKKVYQVIKEDEKNEKAELQVKEVQLIEAEVKVIKCLVESVVVDISFNQTSGLGALYFLEEMDQMISQDHLFKRSIILVKAWCYYESRILGAHRGLISTYALETLVLYVFLVFDNSFAGPLEVLYRFLEYFSNFDWDNFCISMWGPVTLHSLPEIAVIPPRMESAESYHKNILLKSCSIFYDGLTAGKHSERRSFVSKFFNVVDPLCIHNNLGRSVSKGNYYRICSAFVFGAKKLARLLDFPKEEMISELSQFFRNTWERLGAGFHTNSLTLSMDENCNISEDPGGEPLAVVEPSFYGASYQIHKIINQHSKDICRHNGIQTAVCNAKNKDDSYISRKNQFHAKKMFGYAESFKYKKKLSSIYSTNSDEGDCRALDKLARFASAKTCFQSRLINRSGIERKAIVKIFDTDEAPQLDCRSKSLASSITGSQEASIIDGSSCSRQSSFQAVVSNGTSHSCHDSATFSSAVTSPSREWASEPHSQQSYITNSSQISYRAPPKDNNYDVLVNGSAHVSDDGSPNASGQVIPDNNSQQRAIANSGAVPSALYPTGPPVPFLDVIQNFNFPSHRSRYDGLHGVPDNETLNFDSTPFIRNVNSGGMPGQQDTHVAGSTSANELPLISAKPNIHGWPHQSAPILGPPVYPYPTVVPAVHFQRFYPPNGPIRSFLSQNSQFVPSNSVWPEAPIRLADSSYYWRWNHKA